MPPYYAAITGAGIVCPAGHSRAGLAEALRAGHRFHGWVTRFEVPEDGPQFACEVDDYDLSEVLGSKKSRIDPVQSHFLATCRYALEEADLSVGDGPRDDVGVAYATTYGPAQSVEQYSRRLADRGARYANPIMFNNTYINAAPSLAAIEWGLRGPNHTLCAGWVGGVAALDTALRALETQAAEAMLAGASESLSETVYLDLCSRGIVAMGENPGDARDLTGMVPSEGAGALVLEHPEAAEGRGASTLGTLLAAAHESAPDSASAYGAALSRALDGAPEPALYLSPADGIESLATAEHEALRRAGLTHDAVRTVRLADMLGEMMAASTPVAIALALMILDPGETALIGALDDGAGGAVVVTKGDAS